MEGNIENRVERLEEGFSKMAVDSASSYSITTQLKDTLKELATSFKDISTTNIRMQTILESLQKEIERGNKSQEIINKKMDSLAQFSADMESMRGVINLLDQREKNDIDRLDTKIGELETKVDLTISEFGLHKEDSKIDIVKSLKNGASWLLNIILGLALIWTLFGQNVRLP